MASPLDSILGSVLGGLGGGPGGQMGGLAGMLLPAVAGLVAGGGLQKIIGQFESHGLADAAGSWVGKGENQSVTPDQVQQALGHDAVGQVAAQTGLSHEEAASAISQVLPAVVDHVTPDGTVPADHQVAGALDALAQSASA
jgi:uncharacterized protein YidB (DUF937 family)